MIASWAMGRGDYCFPHTPVLICSFESLAQGSREPSVECVELLRDAETVDPAQLDSALYGTFTLLQDNTTNVNGTCGGGTLSWHHCSVCTGSVLSGRVPGNSLNDLLRELCTYVGALNMPFS